MVANPYSPALIFYCIVDTSVPSMALRFHCIATEGTCCSGTVTSPLEAVKATALKKKGCGGSPYRADQQYAQSGMLLNIVSSEVHQQLIPVE